MEPTTVALDDYRPALAGYLTSYRQSYMVVIAMVAIVMEAAHRASAIAAMSTRPPGEEAVMVKKKPFGNNEVVCMYGQGGWTASLRVDLSGSRVTVTPAAFQRISKAFKGRAPVIKSDPAALTVIFGVATSDPSESRAEVDRLAEELLGILRVEPSALLRIKLERNSELDSELDELPNCVGVGEAATILGVTKQRVNQLAQRPDFPSPVFRLRATPVWRDVDVRRFASTRRTGPN